MMTTPVLILAYLGYLACIGWSFASLLFALASKVHPFPDDDSTRDVRAGYLSMAAGLFAAGWLAGVIIWGWVL